MKIIRVPVQHLETKYEACCEEGKTFMERGNVHFGSHNEINYTTHLELFPNIKYCMWCGAKIVVEVDET